MAGGKAKSEHFVNVIMGIRFPPLHKIRATRLSTQRFLTSGQSAALGTRSSGFITQNSLSVS